MNTPADSRSEQARQFYNAAASDLARISRS